jgi:hypothetical protein
MATLTIIPARSNEAGWPTDPWDNEWYRWHNIFDGTDATADISDYLEENRIIVIKSCFPSSEMSGIGSAEDMSDPTIKSLWNYKWHWRYILKIMQDHPENFFVIWTNAPLVANATNSEQAELTHEFSYWAKSVLGAGLDDEFGTLPKNVYIFDFFHKLVDENWMLDPDYAADEWDSHPNAAATELVAPQLVKEIFDAAIAYERYYNTMRNRVNFQLQNIQANEDVFTAEVWAFPDQEIGWDVGSSNIVVNYNSNALDPDENSEDESTGIDDELYSEGYSINQTKAGQGKVSLNIMRSGSPFVNKTEPFKIAELQWVILNNVDYHNLSINVQNTEVFNENDLQLIYNCDSDNCYGVFDNNNGIIGGDISDSKRVWFTIKNRAAQDDVFSAELWAYAPDDGGMWDIGSCNIILNYNSDALSAANYNGIEIDDADQQLLDDGYFFTQTALSGGRVSFNILKSSNPFSSLTGWIKLGTLKWDVIESNKSDGLTFNTTNTEVYNGLAWELIYGCNTSSCYGTIDPDEYYIDGPGDQLSAPEIIFPANNADNIVVNPLFQWDAVTNAENYELQVSTIPNFSAITYETSGLNDTELQVTDLSSATKYYWRVRASNDEMISPWSMGVFTTVWDVPEIWDPPSTAGPTHTVTAESDIEPTIGERDFIAGDAIGVFFTDDYDELVCGGYGVWNGGDLGITVYGDDPATEEKDGFDENEPFFLKVWDSMDGEQYDAEFTIRDGDPTSFQEDGLSYLETLHGITQITHILNLAGGWNMISTYAIPEDPSIDLLLEAIEDDMLIVRNIAGQMYFPSLGINSIGNWNLLEGYKVYMLNPATLEIIGLKAKPQENPIELNTGWAILSYLREADIDIETAVATIEGRFLLIKDISGKIYFPSIGISSLNTMAPGNGYQIYMLEEGTLTYPDNSSPRKSYIEQTPLAEVIVPEIIKTGNSLTLILYADEAQDDNEIGVFSSSGRLIGSGRIYKGVAPITIWGDNEQTEIADGALTEEHLNVMIYDKEAMIMKEVMLSDIRSLLSNKKIDDLIYIADDVIVAKASIQSEIPESNNTISCKPNPTRGEAEIDFRIKSDNYVSIKLYTITGKFIKTINESYLTSGDHSISFDLSDFANGVYNLQMVVDGISINRLLIVSR